MTGQIGLQIYHFKSMRRNPIVDCLMTLLLSIWLVASCTPPNDAQPDNLIPEPRMAAILTEIHIAEGRVSRLGISTSDSSNIVYKRLEKQIFWQLQVDTSAYTKSYIYYSSHPRQMEAVYEQVIENLKERTEEQQKQLHTKRPAPAQKTTRP